MFHGTAVMGEWDFLVFHFDNVEAFNQFDVTYLLKTLNTRV